MRRAERRAFQTEGTAHEKASHNKEFVESSEQVEDRLVLLKCIQSGGEGCMLRIE